MITDLWKERGDIITIVHNVTTNDLGQLGKEFVKHGIIKDDVEAYTVIEFLKENV